MMAGSMKGSIAKYMLAQSNQNLKRCMTSSIKQQFIRSIQSSSEGGGQRTKASSKASASAPTTMNGGTGSSVGFANSQGSILSVSSESILSSFEQEGEKQRTKMSAVQRGTTYEEHVKSFLQNTFPRMDLMRIGGAHDGGIDLTGWWWSPLTKDITKKNDRIRITVQCKSEARKLGPRHVREMHGTMIAIQRSGSIEPEQLNAIPQSILESSSSSSSSMQSEHDRIPAMAILASSSGFSKQCLIQAFTAPFPLLLVHLLFPDQNANFVQDSTVPFAHPTIAANDALLNGLLQSQLEVRWSSTVATHLKQGAGRKSAPVKIDMPALYLGGRRL